MAPYRQPVRERFLPRNVHSKEIEPVQVLHAMTGSISLVDDPRLPGLRKECPDLHMRAVAGNMRAEHGKRVGMAAVDDFSDVFLNTQAYPPL